jgi:predicted ArsR family transcriptional regulator
MTESRTLSAAAISRQLTHAGFTRSVSTGDGSGTCTHGFITRQDSPWRATVCVRPQDRPDLQEQIYRHAAQLRDLGYAVELHRMSYTGAPLVIRVTQP